MQTTPTFPAAPSALLELAVELNAIASVTEALPVLVEGALELSGAATVSVVSWNDELTEGVVRAAAGIADERVGCSVRGVSSLPMRAVRSGRPTFGPGGPRGFPREVEEKMKGILSSVSVPVLGAEGPTTMQAGWTHVVDDEELAAAADLLSVLLGLAGIGRRTSREQVHREERARLDAVLDAAADGILLKRDGRWLANAAAQRILALPDETLPPIGTFAARTLDGRPIATLPELEEERFRLRIRNHAGEELVLDASRSTGPVPVIVFRDVTAEYRLEHATTEYLRALLDTIPTPISVVEADSRRLLSVNRAFQELVGLSEDEVLGASPPYPWWSEGEQIRESVDGDRYARIYRHRDGRPVPVELELHEIHDEDGRATAHLAVITDLTERRRFEQQLVQSGKLAAIGELAAGVAHEINNPLFAILGLIEFLLKDAEPGTKAHERLVLIQQTGLEIKEIVRSLLDFARESSDDRRTVGLDEVILETVQLVRRASANHGIEIVEVFGTGPFPVHGSPNQLKQIFLNLLANARQALPDGGTITIRLERDGSSIVASVGDTGRGVPAEALQQIFEPFYTTKRDTGGTGLGLSVSIGIAQSHGGSLTATSSPDEGATFTLRLPLPEAV